MTRTANSLVTPAAHLVGPGKLKIFNGRLAFSNGKSSPVRLDPAALETIVCYGDVGITDEAFSTLFQHRVQVSWLSPRGARMRGRLAPIDDSLSQLRLAQYRATIDPALKLQLARPLVQERLQSQRDAARHYQRHGQRTLRDFAARAQGRIVAAQRARDLNVLRGLEGVNTREWFELFGQLLPHPWSFPGRVRRPPTDPVNALLSLGYTWLFNKTVARIQAAGLEPSLGVLHDFRHGRASLACDLIEPMRVPLVDRWILRRCNQGSFGLEDFETADSQGTRLCRGRFADALNLWEKDWQREGHSKLEQTVVDFTRRLREAI